MSPLRRPVQRAAAHLFLALALLASGACIEFEQLIKIKPDGSGELIQKIKISERFFEEMAASGQEVSQEELEQGFEEMKTQFQAAPESLGEGVRFLDVQPIPADAGSSLPMSGYEFRFAFDDVNALDFNAFPELGPQGTSPAGPGGDAEADGEESDRLSFRFETEGKRSILSAVFFESQEQMEAEMTQLESTPTTDDAEMDEMAEAMFEMVEEMLGGFRLAVVVEVMGELTDTNATDVEGNRVTLVELDFDRVLAQKEKLERLADIDGQPTLSQIGLLLQEVDGVTFPTTPEVTIEFQ